MIKTARDAFLGDSAENPDDDAPRLIFADWLDEHGEARRAEFIRVQVELAKAEMELPTLCRRDKELDNGLSP